MTRLLLLLISCATLFAQRTPFKVNGTVVNNPDLTNSATIAWTIVGAKISGAAAGGGGGDTIWTNDNGTISATSTVTNGVYPQVTSAFTIDTGNLTGINRLLTINRFGTNAFRFLANGSLLLGDDSAIDYYITYLNPGFVELQADGSNDIILLEAGNDYFDRPNIGISNDGGGTFLTHLDPTVADGTPPYIYDSSIAHTSGNLSALKNHGTDVVTETWDGVVNAVGGFGSTATDAAVTIASTGWTNTFGKNAVVYMDGVGLTFKVANNVGTFVYTNSTTLTGSSVILQPSGKVMITAGSLNLGRAVPF